MSIYCSIFGFGGPSVEHSPRCKRIHRISKWEYRQDDSKPCTCSAIADYPIQYQHSGVLPSNKDKRGGIFSIAAIPGHITRGGREAKPFKGNWHPWLRVSLDDAPKGAIVLTRVQVEKLRDALNDWLERTEPERKKKS